MIFSKDDILELDKRWVDVPLEGVSTPLTISVQSVAPR